MHEVEAAENHGFAIKARAYIRGTWQAAYASEQRAEQVFRCVDLGLRLESSGLQPREVKQVGDQAVQAIRFDFDRERALISATQLVRESLDRGERRAQIVGYRRNQRVLELISGVQRFGTLGLRAQAHTLYSERRIVGQCFGEASLRRVQPDWLVV